MKKIPFLIFLLAVPVIQAIAQVGINTDNSTPDASAILDVKSASKGVLIPRMTTTERNQITNPAEGLMIYNLTNDCIEYFTQSVWRSTCGCNSAPSFYFTSPLLNYTGTITGSGPDIGKGSWSIACGGSGGEYFSEPDSINTTFYGNTGNFYQLVFSAYNSCGISSVARYQMNLAEGIFVDGLCGMNLSGRGGFTNPVQTIAYAIQQAQLYGRHSIFISEGIYDEQVTLPGGITLYGGFSHFCSDNVCRDISNNITEIRYPGKAVIANYGTSSYPTGINGITVRALYGGGSNYAVYVISSSSFSVVNCNIFSAQGAPGTNGSNGVDGTIGSSGNHGNNGCNNGGTGCGTCSIPAVGLGGSNIPGSYGGNGGSPGFGQNNGSAGVNGQGSSPGTGGSGGAYYGWPGSNGQAGGSGTNGSNGTGGLSFGAMSSSGYLVSGGNNGTDGTNGSGGGGGGGAGGEVGPSPSYCKYYGASGGGGGCGGAKGTAGAGGGGGYGSFGVWAYNSTNLVITSTTGTHTITTGNGGNGGCGGRGGAAGFGGTGGLGGKNAYNGLYTGSGGHGGNGGKGGDGGGGGGGPSVGVAKDGSSTVTVTNMYYSTGNGGPGGSCSGNNGQTGISQNKNF